MHYCRIGTLTFAFDALKRDEVLSLLVEQIAKLSPTAKKILAMYYEENLQMAQIASELGLTEYEVDQIRSQTVRLLQTNLCRHLEQPDGLDGIPMNTSGPRSPYPWLEG